MSNSLLPAGWTPLTRLQIFAFLRRKEVESNLAGPLGASKKCVSGRGHEMWSPVESDSAALNDVRTI